MIAKEQIMELAKYFKIDESSIIREYLQLLFLRSFYLQKSSQHVFFKGGTAIHFHYQSFRFSEDLDFTAHLKPVELEKMLAKTMADLQSEIEGIKLGSIAYKTNSCTSQLKLDLRRKVPLTIRLEFSFREKVLTGVSEIIETRFPLVSYPLVVHLDAEELLAEKIRALVTRSKGRDLFDIWYLLSKGIKIREDYVIEKLKWFKKEYKKEELSAAIRNIKENNLYNDLAKFLPQNYRAVIHDLKRQALQKIASL